MFSKMAQRGLVLCCCVVCLFAGCKQSSGRPKFPVKGVVLVNGKPAERMAVLFHHTDESIPGNARYPTAVTDKAGLFSLSTDGNGDGAIEGKYRVTFTWLSSGELDAFDMLGGAKAVPSKSEFEVTVPLQDKKPLEFSMQIPESEIRKAPERPAERT